MTHNIILILRGFSLFVWMVVAMVGGVFVFANPTNMKSGEAATAAFGGAALFIVVLAVFFIAAVLMESSS